MIDGDQVIVSNGFDYGVADLGCAVVLRLNLIVILFRALGVRFDCCSGLGL